MEKRRAERRKRLAEQREDDLATRKYERDRERRY
jgi:hypothetical protein